MDPGAYHYHANINCTDAGAATGANDSDECVLIGDLMDLKIEIFTSLISAWSRLLPGRCACVRLVQGL